MPEGTKGRKEGMAKVTHPRPSTGVILETVHPLTPHLEIGHNFSPAWLCMSAKGHCTQNAEVREEETGAIHARVFENLRRHRVKISEESKWEQGSYKIPSQKGRKHRLRVLA